MTTTFTHEFNEAGNGFPQTGDDVICEQDGDISLLTVTDSSPIHTRQWQANMIYVTCEPSDTDWDDLDEEEQDRLYASAHRVTPCESE